MRPLVPLALSAGAAALLAACGAPAGTSDAVPDSPAITTRAAHSGSWMLPGANGADLVYSTCCGGQDVYVYSYPSGNLVGTLGGFKTAQGLCTDKNGNVFVTDLGTQDIVEYAHAGSTPIATLSDEGNDPNGCAVDPKTGTLAVGGGLLGDANVAIFPHATGSPTVYPDQFDSMLFWCTYDSRSNLFIEPWDQRGGTIIELPAGSSNLQRITVNQSVNPGGDIQWDGKHVVLGNPTEQTFGPSTLYQLSISGSSATVTKTITLSGGKGQRNRNPRIGNQFAIFGNKVLDVTHFQIATWGYPGGGYPKKRFTAYSDMGLTVSVAKRAAR